jgi:hypothetical protein
MRTEGLVKLTEDQQRAVIHSRTLGVALLVMEYAEDHPKGSTTEEFMNGLKLSWGRFFPRFYELLHAGCLTAIGKRKTSTGAYARVYKIVAGATFARYLTLRKVARSSRKVKQDMTDVERAVLAAGMKALTAWHSGSDQRRRNAVVEFVRNMNCIVKLGGDA